MECKEVYSMDDVKFTDAQQAKAIYNFKKHKGETSYNQHNWKV
jgi:chitodextrinase